jgi:putative ABC transport system permease protein
MMPHRRFKWLLRLLPTAFREEHERELLQTWKDEWQDQPPGARATVWRRALIDTLRVAPREFAVAGVHNLRIAVRTLRKSPAFMIAAVLTLSIGTGATGAVFSLVNAVLLRPFPWSDPERVGLIWAVSPSNDRTWLSAPELDDLAREIDGFERVAGFTDLRFALVVDGKAVEVQAVAVSDDFFPLLGVTPAQGRSFTDDEDHRTGPRAVMLTESFWRTRFGGDPAVVGGSVRMNDNRYAVVGIVPDAFEWLPASSVLPGRVDVWVALEPHLAARDRSIRFLHAISRLRDDTTYESVRSALQAYAQRARRAQPAAYGGGEWTFNVVPFHDELVRTARMPLLVLFGLVLLVLLMACANVANLLLARGEGRRNELAVRTALGASRARLAGELLAEAVVLAGLGSLSGLVVAAAVPRVLRAFDPAALPRLDGLSTDGRVVLMMVALVAITSLLFALVPMIERARLRSTITPLGDRSAGHSPRRVAVGRTLVVAQTALAVTVLVAAAFLSDTFQRLQSSEIGFDTRRLLTARVTAFTPPALVTTTQLFDNIVDAVARVPGVVRAGAVSQLPLSGSVLGSTFLAGPATDGTRIDADLRGITSGYFDAAAIPVRGGRGFDARDQPGSPPVAVVDERFARMLDTDGNVVGRRIRWFRQPEVEIEIVGIVGSVRHTGVADDPKATVYRPVAQYPRASMFLVARTAANPATLTSTIVDAVAQVNADVPVADVTTMTSRVERDMTRARTSLMLAATLAVLAVSLAVVGIYGVLSFGVSQRRREFGVRMAVGATPGAVIRLVVREGAILTICGIAAGALAAWFVVGAASALLYGGDPRTPMPYVVAAAIAAGSAGAALWLPARRAGAADPIQTLRSE